MDQCVLITSKYAHTQGSVYSNNKKVCTHTHRNLYILITRKYAHPHRDMRILITSTHTHTPGLVSVF